MISSEEHLNRSASSIAPYIQELYECTMAEAKTIAKIMYTAMIRQIVVEGSSKTPMGSISLVISSKHQYPLRFKMRTPRQVLLQINSGDVIAPTSLEATLLPEHFAALAVLQKKASLEREEFLGSLQKNTDTEL